MLITEINTFLFYFYKDCYHNIIKMVSFLAEKVAQLCVSFNGFYVTKLLLHFSADRHQIHHIDRCHGRYGSRKTKQKITDTKRSEGTISEELLEIICGWNCKEVSEAVAGTISASSSHWILNYIVLFIYCQNIPVYKLIYIVVVKTV